MSPRTSDALPIPGIGGNGAMRATSSRCSSRVSCRWWSSPRSVGLMLAPGSIHPCDRLRVAILCIAVGAGASGALNMWYDADIDSR
jgi:hypothetical protein